MCCCFFAAGCPAGLEEQSHVSKLRVLGVRAEPPELILQADAGLPAATLTALAVTPDGGAQSVRFAICTQITSVPDPSLDCPGDAGIDLPGTSPVAARLDLADPRILEFAAAAQFDAGVFDVGGIAQALDQGVPLLIGFTATNDQEQLSGFETITLRSPARGPADVNPTLTDLEIGCVPSDGGPPTVDGGQQACVLPIAAPKDDPSKRFTFSFFATGGSMQFLRTLDLTATGAPATPAQIWTAPETAQRVKIWVVVRDGRGGTDFIEREVQVR